MSNKKILSVVKDKTTSLLELMDIAKIVEVDYEELEGGDLPTVKITIKGEDVGFLIGYHGQHIESLQFVISMMVNRELGDERSVNILLDAGGYLDEKTKRIESIAMTKADDCRIMGEPVHLHPMNSFERRIVHTVLGKFDDIVTSSEGEGKDRHIVITPKSDEEIGVGESTGNPESEEEES